MATVSSYPSIITLNINESNFSNKRHKMVEGIKETQPLLPQDYRNKTQSRLKGKKKKSSRGKQRKQ